MPTLFSVLTSKIFMGLSALLLTLLVIQTVRIEGVFCSDVKAGQKPACIIKGFKQNLAIVRIDLDAVKVERDVEIAKHAATKRAYAEAQMEAARLEKERLLRVEARQQEITDDLVKDYETRIAAARANAQRLRSQINRRTGSGGATVRLEMPGFSDAAGGPDATASDRRLSINERLIATEQATQLDSLISWVQKQMNVGVN